MEPKQVDLYDLLEALIERTPWRDEAEPAEYRKLIASLREINLFGYMATATTIDQPQRISTGIAPDRRKYLP